MQRHWAKHGPPAYMAIALYLGLSRLKEPRVDRLDDPADLTNFLSAFPGATQT